jgi:hypothetical protein
MFGAGAVHENWITKRTNNPIKRWANEHSSQKKYKYPINT